MLQLSIPIPNITGKQEIEIAMKVNGATQVMHFCIDIFRWDDCTMGDDERVQCIRNVVRDYGDEWMIYDIGIPTDDYVPLTFVRTDDWLKQRGRIMQAVRKAG